MFKNSWGRTLAMLMLVLAFSTTGCVPPSTASRVISEAAIVLTDATNAVNIAEGDLSAVHLSPDEQAEGDLVIAKAREAISAADATVAGAKDITDEELDTALAQFRVAWSDITAFLNAQTPPNARAATLPVPLAVRRLKDS